MFFQQKRKISYTDIPRIISAKHLIQLDFVLKIDNYFFIPIFLQNILSTSNTTFIVLP